MAFSLGDGRWGAGLAALLVGLAGCADESGGLPTGGAGGAATGGGGAGGDGGKPFNNLCGVNCGELEAPPCFRSLCNEGDYPGQIGACVEVPQTGTPCEDGLFCTVNDICLAGVCTAGLPNDCGMAPSECQMATCDEESQTCELFAMGNGMSCTADDLCTVNGVCVNGSCVGEPKDCVLSPFAECNDAVCNPANGQCEPMLNPDKDGLTCSISGDPCMVDKTCLGGQCVGGTPKDCSANDVGCFTGMCNAVTGVCESIPIPDNGACDDGDPCTTNEVCLAGVCGPGNPTMTCGAADFCCPSNCNGQNDTDCTLSVLLLGANYVATADWETYRLALTAAGETWDEIVFTNTLPDAATLNGYNTIIWFAETTLDPADTEAQKMVNWLNAGDRRLMVSSVDFMWDFQNSTPGNGENNMYQAWGATYLGTNAGAGISELVGVASDPIGGVFSGAVPISLSGNGDSNGDYASAGVATVGLTYGPGGAGSGQAALTHYDSGTYRAVWLGVNFHNGLTNQLQRDLLMAQIVNYFKAP